jgi:RHH-type rel operon transcriptional repressor/antitoxin RelB
MLWTSPHGVPLVSESITMTVRLSRQLKDRLERLAESTRRSKSYLAAEAIAEYVEGNAWQVEEIRKAVQKADAGGPFVSEEDATRYLDALARGEDPKPPRTFRAR